MGHFPAGASVKSFVHYGQIVKTGEFKMYDYGSEKANFEQYHQDTPPMIDLTKITEVPTAMFVGTVDDLGDVTDCQWARDQIKSAGDALIHYEEIPAGHSSFMVAKDMSYVDTLIKLLDTYS